MKNEIMAKKTKERKKSMEQNNTTKDFSEITSNEEIFNSQLELTLAVSIAGLFIVPVLYFMTPHWQQPALKYISSILMFLGISFAFIIHLLNLPAGYLF